LKFAVTLHTAHHFFASQVNSFSQHVFCPTSMMLIRRCGFTITIKRKPYNFYYSTPAESKPLRGNANNYLAPSKTHSVLQLPSPVAAPRVSPLGGDECSSVPEVANGKMSCLDQRQGKKCTPVCDEGHVFYQKFSSRPPTYICSGSRVDWKINKFIPDCSPGKKTKVGGDGADSSCPPGWEWREGLCVACPPGMFRDSAPLCQLCPKGSFSTKFGTRECSLCSPGEYTTSLGSRQPSDCRRGGGRGIHYRQRSFKRLFTFRLFSSIFCFPFSYISSISFQPRQ
jgi:hypothetical protein